MNKRGFASDNNAGVHPRILEAMAACNQGHTIGYGDDVYTKTALEKFKTIFGNDTETFFVFTGTAANVLGITAISQSFNSVICAETAHIHVDECGAPEKFSGCKLLSIPTSDGKLTPESIKKHLHGFDFEHHSQPGLVSITQVTEMGTLYTAAEIKAIADLVHDHDMYLHMDGARIANAAVALNSDFKSFTRDAGVDILSFGGTKNGMMYGEAIVFMNPALAKNFKYLRKQGMQLASKMRYMGAQFIAYFEDNLWHKNATHANAMAGLLAEKLGEIPGVEITQPVQANGVFVILPRETIASLQNEYFFYIWNESRAEVRLMASFDTSEEDVLDFCSILEAKLETHTG